VPPKPLVQHGAEPRGSERHAIVSTDPEQAFFADGLAEIADKLKVSHVLEGSVRRSGDRLRITTQLFDARFIRRPDASVRLDEYALSRDLLCSLRAYRLAPASRDGGQPEVAEEAMRNFAAAAGGIG
jgi:hypothetical protein